MNDKQRATFELCQYLMREGVHVVPLAPGKKYPTMKDWPNYHIKDDTELEALVLSYHGFGIMPGGSWVYVDLDCDHSDDVDGVRDYMELVPRDKMVPTLKATKPGSRNVHLFYRNSTGTQARRTGDAAVIPGVEFSARDSQVRLTGYEFQNLDMTRGFLDQLADMPTELAAAVEPVAAEKTYTRAAKRSNNVAKYLAKVAPFEPGNRQSGYRLLVYTMVEKHGMDYDEVKAALDEWDAANVGFAADDPREYEHATRRP